MKVDHLDALIKKLVAMKSQATDEVVVIGFTQTYALIVHEDLSANHAAGKSAKYLEIPARQAGGEIARVVSVIYKKTKSMSLSLVAGGLRLLREAQQIVPIDTAALKASGFCCLEKDYESTAEAAFQKSEGIRLASKKK